MRTKVAYEKGYESARELKCVFPAVEGPPNWSVWSSRLTTPLQCFLDGNDETNNFGPFLTSLFIQSLFLDLRLRKGPIKSLPLVGWLVVSPQNFSKTAPRISLIFCMEVHYYEGKKRARPFFREKSNFSKMGTYHSRGTTIPNRVLEFVTDFSQKPLQGFP